MKVAPRSVFDLVEDLHLAHALLSLDELGVLSSLQTPTTAARAARAHGLDPRLLHGTLEYLAARTDLIRKQRDRFVVTPAYAHQARFLLNLYGGTYRRLATQHAQLLRDPSRAAALVDKTRYARALDVADPRWFSGMAAFVQQLQLNEVLDLGCGSGQLLIQLAGARPEFIGWGVERNRATCRVARARITTAGMTRQLRIFEGDAERIQLTVPRAVRDRIKAVTASHVVNDLFQTGSARVVTWLRGLRRQLPGRLLILNDYYGRLGSTVRGLHRETLLHDYVQLLSGQGIPPPRLSDWRALYEKAGARLVHVLEDTSTTRFIHLVVLQ